MEPLGLVVRFVLKEGAAAEFDALTQETVAGISVHEPGTLLYVIHVVDGEPLQRIFYELYRDDDAFAAHEAQPHTQRFLTERERFVDSFVVEWVRPLSAKGLDTSGRTQ